MTDDEKTATSVRAALVSQLRRTRPGLATMLDAERYFLVPLFGDDYGKAREWRARHGRGAHLIETIEIVHPDVGSATGLVMMPDPQKKS